MIENDYVQFWKENGILYGRLKHSIDFGIKEMEEMIKLRHLISNNEYQYLCVDYRNLKAASKEAHDYGGKFGNEFLYACALVTNTFLTNFIMNVYLRVQKPIIPVKVFSSQEKAVKWLMEVKETNKQLNRCLN